jgi:hypothetical protein
MGKGDWDRLRPIKDMASNRQWKKHGSLIKTFLDDLLAMVSNNIISSYKQFYF